MPNQIIDIVEIATPGPMGDVTPAALQAVVDARAEVTLAAEEADRAEAARDQAEVFAAGTAELQDQAISQTISDPSSLSYGAMLSLGDDHFVTRGVAAPPTAPRVQVSDVMSVLDTPHAHNAFPGLALVGGKYLCVWRGGANHNSGGVIYAATSGNGAEWGDAYELISISGQDLRDPTLATLANGDVLLTFYNANTGKSYLVKSLDGGTTWGEPTEIPFSWTEMSFVAAPIVEVGSALIVGAYGRDVGGATQSGTMRSTDGGNTWANEVIIPRVNAPTPLTEPQLISLGGNNLLVLLRTDTTIRKAVSSNGGLSWSPEAYAFAGTGTPRALRFRSGTIAVYYRDVDTKWGVLRTSNDDGVTWSAQSVFGYAGNQIAEATAVETETDGMAVLVWSTETDNSNADMLATFTSERSGVSPYGGVRSQYAAPGGELEAWLPATAFMQTAGTPTSISHQNNLPIWRMNAGDTTSLTTTFKPPVEWKSFVIELWWCTMSVSGGSVKFNYSTFQMVNGSNITTGVFVPLDAIAAPATTNTVATRRLGVVDIAAEGRICELRILRAGPDETDTNTGDIGLIGVRVARSA